MAWRGEKAVIAWVARGKSNKEIAQILDLSPATVANHVHNALMRHNCNNRVTLTLSMLANGEVPLEPLLQEFKRR